MTPLLLLLAAAQAGLLLWAAVHLSNVAMRPRKFGSLFWGAVTLGLPLAIAMYGSKLDPVRSLCGPVDCLILALGVAGVRVYAVTKQDERLALEYEERLRLAAEAAEAARQARRTEQVKAAAAALEARTALAEKKAVAAEAPRHLTTSILRGGAPSPRLPTSPRK
jgi:hypothetical protein